MPRPSVESAKQFISTLLSEQERDREHLQRMLAHSEKMTEYLQMMRDEEEQRIDAEAAERKAATRKLFSQLIAVEEERKDRISLHIADIEGQRMLGEGDGNPYGQPTFSPAGREDQ
jgi:transcription antitermination factor NusG